ncbi:putative PRC domain-containing protein [Candidatus Hydrogenisulfobacillus filiaventi]|uniref:Putative PRC domain-containing protein n=1 Tax=Candidatus Hydrogenisulfobacillus filiaventi TaxID=2707344 RepID=A0A6F8ZHM6_9FIRM|nr:putative PRC domain-containing protein [Candidatus Hydrogenisulfobacillus filiaventi]
MIRRWELLHLPVRLGSRQRAWGRVEELELDWGQRQVTGVLARAGLRLFLIPTGPEVRLHARGVEVARPDLPQPVAQSWWRRQRAAGRMLRPLAVYDPEDHYLGRLTDIRIREDTGAVTDLLVSRGVLADLWQGLLVVPARGVQERHLGPPGITVDPGGDTNG